MRQGGVDSSGMDMVRETARFVSSMLDASGAVFYWLDDSNTVSDPVIFGVSQTCLTDYDSDIWQSDPLLARRLVDRNKRIGLLKEESAAVPADARDRYRGFLSAYDIEDCMDMLFWKDGRAFAGLGVLKLRSDSPLSATTLATAQTMQSYVEVALHSHPSVTERQTVNRLQHQYGLTQREIDVVMLVSNGATNADVAQLLGIGLATAKTHMINIFNKMGVENRAAMVARVVRP
ncbi:helix-turn-helix transcriptional regulator [Devosia sp. YIM 151766]|uniref:helix-turn-helix transcriptional regulator n=1 Tax=Devosia sp. YIM 151766 TaxID=3017325 RepID=UPI00255C7FB2|nr:helix-turn-helix transcriptional regulator [Devosia sp. YIM 151766]WIY52976.1 helix-turn-helix transcriptional regulator [Devosia sp. YIM 151766]